MIGRWEGLREEVNVLFPFAEYWWFYLGFTTFILGLLALDLGVFHRKQHAVGLREATTWTAVWIGLALAFGGGLYYWSLQHFQGNLGIASLGAEAMARQVTLEYYTGFVIEKALAVDNIFVFAMAFSWFGIRPEQQHRILFYGILGALGFRALFIALGSVLMQFQWIVMLAGVFLIGTGLKMAFAKEAKQDPDSNTILRMLKKVLPITYNAPPDRFWVLENGRRYGTPLLVALLFIEVCDIIFAVDSVPAIFAVTDEPLLVFTSNIFAILGLRSMYFMLSSVLDRFHLLKYGLAAILVFVGLKMSFLNQYFDGHFPIHWSLAIIGALLGTSVVASLLIAKTPSGVSGESAV